MSHLDRMNEDDPTAKTPADSSGGAAPARRRLRGFAAMDPAMVRAIARKGGLAAHERGTAHRFTTDEAQEAGRKGGLAPHRSRGGGPGHRRSSGLDEQDASTSR